MNRAQKHSANVGTLVSAVANMLRNGTQDVTLVRAIHKSTGEQHYVLCAVNHLVGTDPATGKEVKGEELIPLARMFEEDPSLAYRDIEEIPNSELMEGQVTRLILPPGVESSNDPIITPPPRAA